MKSPGSKIDSGSGKCDVIGAASSEGLTACNRGFSHRFATCSFYSNNITSGIQGNALLQHPEKNIFQWKETKRSVQALRVWFCDGLA